MQQLRTTPPTSPLTPSNPTEERARKQEAMARVLGKRRFADVDWRQLVQEGVLVDLTIRHCGFTARLELSDLGMSIQDERVRRAHARTLKLGEKRLLPQRYMNAINRLASGARRCLAKNAFQTELGAFLPVTAYGPWKEEIAEHERRFLALRDEILENYKGLVEEVLAEYRVIARDTYKRLRILRPTDLDIDEARFIENYCNRILALIPAKEYVRERFGFDIVLRDGVQELQPLSETTRVPAPIQVRQDAQNRVLQRQQMQRDLLRQLQEQKARQIEDFLQTIVIRLRSLTYEVMGDVLASISKQGEKRFPARSVVQLKNLVTQLSRLNFYGDEDIERIEQQVQEILDQTPTMRKRNLTEIQERLREIALDARSTLLDLEQPARKNRAEIPAEVPKTDDVRQARAVLDLNAEQVLESLASLPRREAREAREGWQSLWDQSEETRAPRLM